MASDVESTSRIANRWRKAELDLRHTRGEAASAARAVESARQSHHTAERAFCAVRRRLSALKGLPAGPALTADACKALGSELLRCSRVNRGKINLVEELGKKQLECLTRVKTAKERVLLLENQIKVNKQHTLQRRASAEEEERVEIIASARQLELEAASKSNILPEFGVSPDSNFTRSSIDMALPSREVSYVPADPSFGSGGHPANESQSSETNLTPHQPHNSAEDFSSQIEELRLRQRFGSSEVEFTFQGAEGRKFHVNMFSSENRQIRLSIVPENGSDRSFLWRGKGALIKALRASGLDVERVNFTKQAL